MDFEPNADQQAILEAVGALLAQHAGAKRAIELNRTSGYDRELDAALDAAGFQGVALGEGTGLLEAALVVEAVAKAGGVVGIGASALVAPGLTGRALPGTDRAGEGGRHRAGALRRARAHAARRRGRRGAPASRSPRATPRRCASNFMLPMGRVRAPQAARRRRWAPARGSGCAASGASRSRPRWWGRWRPASR